MSDNCSICRTQFEKKPISVSGEGGFAYECPRCGNFTMSLHTQGYLPHLFDDEKGKDNEEKIAVLSHAIRKMQKDDFGPDLTDDLIKAILKRPLPTLPEQVNNFIIWLAENVGYGGEVFIQASTHQSIMGALVPKGFKFIIKHLFDTGILDGHIFDDGTDKVRVTLTFRGWEYYRELERGAVDSRKAFMAMEYGNEELDKIVDDHFKQAVADTGFELYRLDKNPKGGSIDDRLRVEIRNSRFLISDLSHGNNGAYWEAGYAEGLGKPVIYTCNEEKFDKMKTHFDTNHHLTVKWNAEKIGEAVEMLKATIRATLPDEAKLSDD